MAEETGRGTLERLQQQGERYVLITITHFLQLSDFTVLLEAFERSLSFDTVRGAVAFTAPKTGSCALCVLRSDMSRKGRPWLTRTRIHNTERNLDLASGQNRLAAEKAREIKTLNVSHPPYLISTMAIINTSLRDLCLRCTSKIHVSAAC